MKPRYTIERWPHGWLLCGPDGHSGIPANALSECQGLFPKKAVMNAAIPHHLRAHGNRNVVFCVGVASELALWSSEIAFAIRGLPAQERWWKGLDVGMSSAAIFAVFCEPQFQFEAKEMSRGAIPRDADDFGRCCRLLDAFPEWRPQLNRVAEAYPETKWKTIVDRWDEIANAPASDATTILSRL